MIITKQKKIDEILKIIGKNSVFIVGCSECATLCHTGGEEEVISMRNELEKNNIEVTGWTILDPACHLNNDKRLLKPFKDKTNKSSIILVLACGNGVQTVREIFDDKKIISGTDTIFLGEIKRVNEFEKRCNLCGECLLNHFDGFCPVTRCPKSMLNGPCGGVKNGKCEVNPDMDCVWYQIFKNLKKKGELDLKKDIQKPKDWSCSIESVREI